MSIKKRLKSSTLQSPRIDRRSPCETYPRGQVLQSLKSVNTHTISDTIRAASVLDTRNLKHSETNSRTVVIWLTGGSRTYRWSKARNPLMQEIFPSSLIWLVEKDVLAGLLTVMWSFSEIVVTCGKCGSSSLLYCCLSRQNWEQSWFKDQRIPSYGAECDGTQ